MIPFRKQTYIFFISDISDLIQADNAQQAQQSTHLADELTPT